MSSFSVKCFGVGDGVPNADRSHSSYLYTFGDLSVLIDCGEPVSRSLKASAVNFDGIDRLLISHLHSDHFGGVFMLLQSFWLDQRRKDLIVHLPEDKIAPLQEMLRAAYLFEELLPFKMRFEPLRSREAIKSGSVLLTPYPTTHLDRLKQKFQSKYPGRYEAFCFLLEAGGQRVAHSCDLGAPEDLAPLLADPVDLLVCEVSHFEPQALFDYLSRHRLKRLALVHIARWQWEQRDKIHEAARKTLPGVQVIVPRDQEQIVV
ncbi:MAG TPA: MBL fold metallo-hydrolase [Verrucomicrobiae bacterium]|nr:MBL fold metallo-hydrolase [Verrucomicrobiae bacterium]